MPFKDNISGGLGFPVSTILLGSIFSTDLWCGSDDCDCDGRPSSEESNIIASETWDSLVEETGLSVLVAWCEDILSWAIGFWRKDKIWWAAQMERDKDLNTNRHKYIKIFSTQVWKFRRKERQENGEEEQKKKNLNSVCLLHVVHQVTRDSPSRISLFVGTPLLGFVSSTLEMLRFEFEAFFKQGLFWDFSSPADQQ